MAVKKTLPTDLIALPVVTEQTLARMNMPSVINQWKFDNQLLNHGGSSTLNLRAEWITPHNGL